MNGGEPALRQPVEQAREAALRERISRLESVIEGSSLGTWEWNVQSGQLICNERWAEMLGYSLSNLEPTLDTWRALMHPDDRAECWRLLEQHFAGELGRYDCEHRMRHQDGH